MLLILSHHAPPSRPHSEGKGCQRALAQTGRRPPHPCPCFFFMPGLSVCFYSSFGSLEHGMVPNPQGSGLHDDSAETTFTMSLLHKWSSSLSSCIVPNFGDVDPQHAPLSRFSMSGTSVRLGISIVSKHLRPALRQVILIVATIHIRLSCIAHCFAQRTLKQTTSASKGDAESRPPQQNAHHFATLSFRYERESCSSFRYWLVRLLCLADIHHQVFYCAVTC